MCSSASTDPRMRRLLRPPPLQVLKLQAAKEAAQAKAAAGSKKKTQKKK